MKVHKFALLCISLIFNLASLQQLIGISPSYIVLFLKRNIKFYEIIFISLLCFAFYYQAFTENSVIINYLQLVFDLLLAYLIVDIVKNSDPIKVKSIINFSANSLLFLALISTLDYYYFGNIVNSILTKITLWGNSGEFIPRLSLTFSNPNWGSFTIFFFLVLSYIFKSSQSLKIKLFFLIFFLQSKSAILISGLFIAINSSTQLYKKIIFSVFFIPMILITLPSLISIEETASYFNRLIMFQEVIDQTELYPQGLMGDNDIRQLITKTGEDTLPSLLTLIYGFGWVFFMMLFSLFLLNVMKSKISFSIFISLVLFSLVYSFLTVGIVSAIGIAMMILAINKKNFNY
jgi:hypothetical protein